MKRVGLFLLGVICLLAFSASAQVIQIQKLQASDADLNDGFGNSVSMDTQTLVIGASGDDGAAVDAGAAYVFTRSGSTWTQQQKLVASDAQAGDSFGNSVWIDGDTMVVGAFQQDTGGADAGAAYVFTRSGSTWTQQQKLVASDAQAGDNFGGQVALNADSIVIGALLEDGTGTDQGAAYVFTRSGSTWTQQQKLQASDRQNDDQFGSRFGLEGDHLLVAAHLEDQGGNEAGAVYYFTRSGSTWTQQQKFLSGDPGVGDQFGLSIAMLGTTAVVGARLEDAGGADAGAAYVFTRSGSTWTQQQKLVASDAQAGDNFGLSVAIDVDTVFISAHAEDTGGSDAGAAYVFTRSGSTWTQQQKLVASDAQAGDNFGIALTMAGNTFVAGATGEDTTANNAGAVYVFDNPDPTEDVEPTFEPRPVEPGGIFGDNGAAFGGNKSALAATMEISVTALEIGMAILWILLFTAIGFLTFNRSMAGALSGGLGGVVWSIAWGLIPLWFVFMLIILTGAGLLVLRRRA